MAKKVVEKKVVKTEKKDEVLKVHVGKVMNDTGIVGDGTLVKA